MAETIWEDEKYMLSGRKVKLQMTSHLKKEIVI